MSFVSEKLHFKLFTVLLLSFVFLTQSLHAQKKSVVAQKKTAQTNSKTQAQKIDGKSSKQAKIAVQKNRAEQLARQQAALDAKRRRDASIRAVQVKKASYERSLRSVTVDNITGDNTDGEDLEVRRAAINALGNRAGTIVVLEAQTGKVLTIINQDWAIRHSFKPCSTIKLVTAIAGINENVIGAGGNINSSNFGMNLDDALAFSNNAYFQRVGANLGSNKMISYAQMLGLGQPTGINAENEVGGKLPFGNNNARIYSHGDDFEVTPLQLAVLVSAISNGGKVIVPRIPRNDFERASFQGYFRREINLPQKNLRGVIPGMIGAAQYGTARRGVDSTLDVAGKTGSCIGGGSWVGLFASVAPIENPKYAVIVITRGQGERGKYAAAVAGKIYQTLRARFDEKGGKLIAKIPSDLKPQSKVNAETSANLDDAEDEDTDDSDSTVRKGKKGGADNIAEQKTAISNVKKAEKTVAKPADLFAPVIIEVKRSSDNPLIRPRIVSKQ
ncbi:MAG: penicillin-binding transpeptidase domain-containing protein [Pyrinomonadaceae bacterium]